MIKKNPSIFLMVFTLCVATYTAIVSEVSAQINMPEFSLSDTKSNIVVPGLDPIDTQINIQKSLTEDILSLQKEINILSGMIERQSEIRKISDNYEKVGIQFRQPLPKQTVCEDLPVNLLCLYSYPDLDINSEATEQIKDRFIEEREVAYQEAMAAIQAAQQQFSTEMASLSDISDEDVDFVNTEQPFIPAEPKEVFAWQDIQCLQNTCTALIRSSKNPDMRLRVQNGETINDNVVVANITNTTVKIREDGQIINLNPLTKDGNFIEQPSISATISSQNESSPKTTISASDIKDAISRNQPAPAQIDVPAIPEISNTTINTPLLGPTGLF